MRFRVRTTCLVAVSMATLAVRAADDVPDKVRRDQLVGERAAVQARYEQAVRECQRGFVVTGCVNQAKAERRAALDRIAREQAVLDDVQRRQRAEERRLRIAQKQAAQAQRAAAASSAGSAPPAQLRAPRASPAASAAKPGRRYEPRSADTAAAAASEAAERAAQSEQRRERAQAHEEAVRQRNAERAANRAPAAPLPVPSAPASQLR